MTMHGLYHRVEVGSTLMFMFSILLSLVQATFFS
jgi:hypothetical protein